MFFHLFFAASFEDDGKELRWLLQDVSVSLHSSADCVKHAGQQVGINVDDWPQKLS